MEHRAGREHVDLVLAEQGHAVNATPSRFDLEQRSERSNRLTLRRRHLAPGNRAREYDPHQSNGAAFWASAACVAGEVRVRSSRPQRLSRRRAAAEADH